MSLTVPPKSAATRQRRNKAVTGATIEAAAAVKPTLDTTDWHANTLRWWDAVWASPMAGEWVEADIPALLRLADLEDRYWRATDASAAVRLAGEIRQQQMQYGLTPLSRRMLQWEIKRVEAARPTVVPAKPRDPRLRAVS